MAALPPGAIYTVLGALAAAENVFPPLPADTVVGMGAFLSHYGAVSPLGIFSVVWGANVLGAVAVYTAGRTVGRQFFTGRIGRRLLNPSRLERLEGLYRKHGPWGIFVSRFLPGVRAVVPPFAGIARVPAWKAILPLTLASGLWYGTVTFTVVSLAHSLEDVVRLIDGTNRIGLAVVTVLVGGVALVVYRRRRTRRP